MVRQLLYAISLFLLLPTCVVAAPQLLFSLKKTEVQVGHHIDAVLYGIDLQEKLIDINLSGLEEHFGVVIVESIEDSEDPRWPGQTVQETQFKLYPRKEGMLSVPELNIADIQTEQQTILVKPAIRKSRKGDINIQHEIKVSSLIPWERQQIIIGVEITTSDTFASLDSEGLEAPGFEVFALPLSNGSDFETTQQNSTGLSIMRIGWVLFPLTAGKYDIELPPIKYRKSGQTLRTFYLPKQNLNVLSLPPYIPPTMPVGKVSITSQLDSNKPILPDTLSYWDIQLTGYGVSPNWMPPILKQIKSNSGIRFLPTSTERKTTATKDVLYSHVLHHIPFKSTSNGKLNLPDIHIQYFDPNIGKIVSTTHQPKLVFVFSAVWRIVLGSIAFLAFLWAGKHFYTWLYFIYRRSRLRKSALAEIEGAVTFVDIRKALNRLSVVENWPANMTLRDFAQHWQSSFKKSEGFDVLMKQLSHACYSKEQLSNLEDFRSLLLALIRAG